MNADVIVVGAGVFGLWTAEYLRRSGLRICVVEAFAPAWSNASSGGESRVLRTGYGGDSLYSDWAARALPEWRRLSTRAAPPLLHETGVLWIHDTDDAEARAGRDVLSALAIPFSTLSAPEVRARYPVLRIDDHETGLVEHGGGAIMAQRALQQLARELADAGVTFVSGQVQPISAGDGQAGAMTSVLLADGRKLSADQFVFACGPWLDRVCPEALAGRLFVTRQEVLFLAASRGLTGALPVWARFPYYGMPDFEGRGFKLACHEPGQLADPDTLDRRGSADAEEAARAFLARRFPAIAGAPITQTRVCQYASSHNADFLVDRHPGLENVWLAGCGSGHGFKHGPSLGAHVAGLLLGQERPFVRFALAAKRTSADQRLR